MEHPEGFGERQAHPLSDVLGAGPDPVAATAGVVDLAGVSFEGINLAIDVLADIHEQIGLLASPKVYRVDEVGIEFLVVYLLGKVGRPPRK